MHRAQRNLSRAQRQELREAEDQAASSESEEEKKSAEPSNPRRRGRTKLPIVWSRVMQVNETSPTQIQAYSVELELQTQVGIRSVNRRSVVPEWSPLFYPDDFASQNIIENLDDWRIPAEQLEKFAKQSSKIRSEIRQRVLAVLKEQRRLQNVPSGSTTTLELRIKHGYYFDDIQNVIRQHAVERPLETPTFLRKKSRRKRMTLEDKITAAHMVFIKCEAETTVARHFRVTQQCVSKLACNLRKNPQLLSELLAKQVEKANEATAVREFIQAKLDADEFIDST